MYKFELPGNCSITCDTKEEMGAVLDHLMAFYSNKPPLVGKPGVELQYTREELESASMVAAKRSPPTRLQPNKPKSYKEPQLNGGNSVRGEIIRVLKNAKESLTGAQIYEAGSFEDKQSVFNELSVMTIKKGWLARDKTVNGFVYQIATDAIIPEYV